MSPTNSSPIARFIARTSVSESRHRQPQPTLLQGAQDFFGRNVSDQIILRKRASAEPADRRIEAAAAGIERGQDLCPRCGRACCAGELRPRIPGSPATPRSRLAESVPGLPLRRYPPEKCADSQAGDRPRRFHDLLFAPRIAIRIAERHRNVGDHLQPASSALSLILFNDRLIFFRRLILIPAQKRFGNGTGIAERVDRSRSRWRAPRLSRSRQCR